MSANSTVPVGLSNPDAPVIVATIVACLLFSSPVEDTFSAIDGTPLFTFTVISFIIPNASS